MLVIPAIDLSNHQVVRLKKGEFDQKTIYEQNPYELIDKYAYSGCPWVHIVDLDGAQNPTKHQQTFIQSLVEKSKSCVQMGGGLRSVEQVESVLKSPIHRVVLGSFVLEKWSLFSDLVQKYTPNRFCVALDIKLNSENQPEIYFKGWQEKSSSSFESILSQLKGLGITWILCTDIDRDGLMLGPNLNLYKKLKEDWPNFQWIASGGIRSIDDVIDLKKSHVDACVIGKALLENKITEEELQKFNQGFYAH